MIPSMSRPANPYDNASCESFMKTLKREEIYANTYRDLDHLRTHVAVFIEQYYNRDRLHSALGYHSPGRVRAHDQCSDYGNRSYHAVFQASSARSSRITSKGSV